MKRLILCFLLWAIAVNVLADMTTDKQMSEIIRNKKSFIAVDTRTDNVEESRLELTNQLTKLILDYCRNQKTSINTIDDVLRRYSDNFECIISQTAPSRWHIMMYVPIDLLSENNFAKNTADSSPTASVSTVDTGNKSENENFSLPAVVEQVMEASDRGSIDFILKDYAKQGLVTTGQYPIGMEEYYIVIVNMSGEKEAVIRYKDHEWLNLSTRETVNPSKFNNCKAVWFSPLK